MKQISQFSRYGVKKSDTISAELQALPKAETYDVFARNMHSSEGEIIAVPGKKAIVVNGEPVAVMSKRYALVQHEQAFRPIVDGLTMRGISDYQYSMWSDNGRASMAVYVGEAADGVKFGFKASNSFDGSSAINFGFKAYQRQETLNIVEKEHVLVWTVRQVCMNGALVRVPLKTCKYLDVETTVKIKEYLSESARIRHVGKVADKLQVIQYVTEAFCLLQGPLNMMIIDAQRMAVTPEKAREMVYKYVGLRVREQIVNQYYKDGDFSLWGLFNSVTFLASHGAMEDDARERLLEKAATMLEAELMPAEGVKQDA
jgi:hypothetical protein